MSNEIKNGYLHTDFKFRYWLSRRKRKDEEMNHFKCFVVNRSEYQSEIKSSMMLFSLLWQAAQLNSNKSQCLQHNFFFSLSLTNKNTLTIVWLADSISKHMSHSTIKCSSSSFNFIVFFFDISIWHLGILSIAHKGAIDNLKNQEEKKTLCAK